jgi:para-aminobenzoate synthetase component I
MQHGASPPLRDETITHRSRTLQSGTDGEATRDHVPMNPRAVGADEAWAWFAGVLHTDLVDVSSDPSVLDADGRWAVVAGYDGPLLLARFAQAKEAPLPVGPWVGPARDTWCSSMSRAAYLAAVAHVRSRIQAGDVYQANVCRVLEVPLPEQAHVGGLATLLAAGNPAPYAGVVHLPDHGLSVVTASPELYLRRRGTVLESGPIKGTGRTADDLAEKDRAENVMIVDLVRNDLGAVCRTGTVTVPTLLSLEEHPGLVHLVSTVRGELRDDVGWGDVLRATFPPGSVTGAPKSSALRIIAEVEPVPRGPYCGAVGWVDADTREAVLAVAIRTFWISDGILRFGTGAGITWGSDAAREWDETELKSARLLDVAAGSTSDVAG